MPTFERVECLYEFAQDFDWESLERDAEVYRKAFERVSRKIQEKLNRTIHVSIASGCNQFTLLSSWSQPSNQSTASPWPRPYAVVVDEIQPRNEKPLAGFARLHGRPLIDLNPILL